VEFNSIGHARAAGAVACGFNGFLVIVIAIEARIRKRLRSGSGVDCVPRRSSGRIEPMSIVSLAFMLEMLLFDNSG
jgi:hypothetical protein